MIPFFGHGDAGKERGAKLALIAGIKENLYDDETLAGYLIWRLWQERPTSRLLSVASVHPPLTDTLLRPGV